MLNLYSLLICLLFFLLLLLNSSLSIPIFFSFVSLSSILFCLFHIFFIKLLNALSFRRLWDMGGAGLKPTLWKIKFFRLTLVIFFTHKFENRSDVFVHELIEPILKHPGSVISKGIGKNDILNWRRATFRTGKASIILSRKCKNILLRLPH